MKSWLRRRIGIAVSVVTCVGVFVYAAITRSSEIDDLSALRQMGIAATHAEVESMWPTEGANAADDYIRAFELLFGESKYKRHFDLLAQADPIQASPTIPLSSVHRVVDVLTPIIEQCIAASLKPRCAFRYFQMATIPGGHGYADTYVINTVLDLLYVSALVRADQGQTLQALKLLETCSNILTQLAPNPQSNSGAFVNMYQNYVALCWLRVLPRCGRNAEAIDAAISVAEKMPRIQSLRKSVANHLPMRFEQYRDARQDIKGHFGKPIAVPGTQGRLYEDDRVVAHAVGQAVHQWRQSLEDLTDDPNRWQSDKKVLVEGNGRFLSEWPLNKYFSPAFEFTADLPYAFAGTENRLRLMRVASQLLKDWLEGKTFPDDLSQFGGDTWDPLGARDFVYVKQQDGFILYSEYNAGPAARKSAATKASIIAGEDFVVKF